MYFVEVFIQTSTVFEGIKGMFGPEEPPST